MLLVCIGYSLMRRRGEVVYLGELAVRGAWQKRGVGRMLVQLIVEYAEEVGAKIICGVLLALSLSTRSLASCPLPYRTSP